MTEFYARPNGSHYHASRDCPMLSGSQFRVYRYQKITLHEARERDLYPCVCAMLAVCRGCEKPCQDAVKPFACALSVK